MGDEGLGLEYGSLASGVEDWTRLGELMRSTGSELDDASTAGLAPTVQGAAQSFLTAWSGYAGESAAISEGLSEALGLLTTDVTATEEELTARFGTLDGRLGSA